MNNLEIKQKLIDHCISKQKDVIEHAKSAMIEAQKSANEYGQPKDRYDSFRNKMLRERDLHARQMDKAIEQLAILNRLIPVKESKKIEFGTLVITKSQNLFISVGLGKIELDGKTYYAISPGVPIYKIIVSLKPGDTYIFNGINHEIVEIT